MVSFSVKDSGKGIEPMYAEKIFEKFYRVPNKDMAVTGTGLDLRSVRILLLRRVERYG